MSVKNFIIDIDVVESYGALAYEGLAEKRAGRWVRRSWDPTTGPKEALCTTRSAFQSVGPSRRTVRTVTSSAAVLPPQTGQRRRQILAKGRAVDDPASWNRTGPLGGQRSVLAVPTGRPQGRQAISAMNSG